MTVEPNQQVIEFLAQVKESYLSVITIHELFYGLQFLSEGQRRNTLANKLQNLLTHYQNYTIPVIQEITLQAAVLCAV
jgi:predicted nucleic acid-binding protein